MPIGLGIGLGLPTLCTGGGASAFAPYPAPTGYRWEFVYEGAEQVFEATDPVIELVVVQ